MNETLKHLVIGFVVGLVITVVCGILIFRPYIKSLAGVEEELRISQSENSQLGTELVSLRSEIIAATGAVGDGQQTSGELAELIRISLTDARELNELIRDSDDIVDDLLEWAKARGY